MSTASFRDRFKDRQEVVGRDGSNSFSHRSSVTGAAPTAISSKAAPQRAKPPLIPPLQHHQQAAPQQQQYQQQQQQYDYSSPSYAAGPSNGYGGATSVAGSQPSFFMTGGGYAAPAPSGYGASPYGIPQAPPAHLPPLGSEAQYQQQQQLGTPPPGGQGQQQQQQQQQPRRGFAQALVSASPTSGYDANGNGLGGDHSPGRRERRKQALPDFHELDVLDHSRRQGGQGRSVERMPVLIDHPVSGEYHQHTLSEYKRMLKEYQSQRVGGLGPEDNEEKQAEREKRRKILEYGRQVNAVNFAVLDQLMGDSWHNRPIERKLDTDAQLAQIKRQRAKLYADAVKPPVVSARSPPKAKTPQPTMNASARELDNSVETLEEKHRRDQEAIRRIKAQLNMV